MSYEINAQTLELARKLLGDLSHQVVFVGGITTFLYVDAAVADDIRPTRDVDCVINNHTKKDYDHFQKQLRERGFTHDTSHGAPICRFVYKDQLILDVMPSDQSILGFSNIWYKEGMENKETIQLGKEEIFIFSLPYFLASKFEAFNCRGKVDPRISWDLEDIVIVLDGIKEFKPLKVNKKLKLYLEQMSKLCLKDDIQEAIAGFLSNNLEKITKINERLKNLVE